MLHSGVGDVGVCVVLRGEIIEVVVGVDILQWRGCVCCEGVEDICV